MKYRHWISAIALCACAASRADAPFESRPWLADLDALERAMTLRYPNFEWAAQRGLDLPALDRRARQRLAAAPDTAAARRALERFIAGFGDGHLSVSWPTNRPPDAPAAAPRPLCAQLGFRADADTTAIARNLPRYAPLHSGGNTGSGILRVGESDAAVLRVHEFEPDLATCETARQTLGLAADAACDARCEDSLRLAAGNLFLADIAAQLAQLRARKPALLIVDVAGNGGGDDSAIALARMLAGDVAAPRMMFVDTPERRAGLLTDIAELGRARRQARGAAREYLAGIEQALRSAAAPKPPCDLSPLWRGEPVTCSNLVGGPFFAAGFSEHALAPEFRRAAWATTVSSTARFADQPPARIEPLLILVDGDTASAAELFAAMLQDAGRATVIGAPTAGAGCGWTLAHQTVVLAGGGARVDMPDCLRLRRDGTNEVDGIEPDVLVGFRTHDSTRQRAQRLEKALQRWPFTNVRQ